MTSFSSGLSGAILVNAITYSATSLTLSGVPAGIPAGVYPLKIDSELMLGTNAGSSSTFTSLARGQEGTTAAAHRAGVVVRHVITAAALNAFSSGGGGTPTTLQAPVTNTTGGTLTKGTVVAIDQSDAVGLTVFKPFAHNGALLLGVVAADIADTASGLVTVQGVVAGLNTSGMSVGDYLYLDPSTAGAFTSTASLGAADFNWQVGFVTVVHATTGAIVVAPFRWSPSSHDHSGAAKGGNNLTGTTITNYFDVLEIAAPASPSAGHQRFYIDSTTHHWTRKNSSGTVVDLG